MKYLPTAFTLKNGKTVIIRAGELTDAVAFNNMARTYLADSPYIPFYPNEFNFTISQQVQWIASYITAPNSLLLVATYDNQLLANIDISGSSRQTMSHVGNIGMGMLLDWRHIGLGTALMQAAIAWAKANPILELLCLNVYATNLAGRALYSKAGFLETGIEQRFFKSQAGIYADKINMSLVVTD
jgi:RimJ/RimL family protein N-acetyltransferase